MVFIHCITFRKLLCQTSFFVRDAQSIIPPAVRVRIFLSRSAMFDASPRTRPLQTSPNFVRLRILPTTRQKRILFGKSTYSGPMESGVLLNISQSLHEPSKHAPNIVPTVPDVAFNWLQVLANAGMVLVMAFALWQLLQLNKAVVRKQVWHMGAFRILGLVLTLAFSLPALYGLAMAILSLLQGHLTIAFGNLRYLVTALCMAYCAMLCLWRLLAWRRSRKGLTIDTPDAHASTALLRSGDSKHP